MRISAKIAIVLACVIAAVSIGTVCATWTYSGNSVDSKNTTVELDMGDNWEENKLLLDAIIENLNESTSNLSINLNSRLEGNGVWSSGGWFDTFINNVIGNGKKDYYGSMDPMVDMTYYFLFSDHDVSLEEENIINDITSNLSYIVEKESDTQMYVYICDTYLGKSGTIKQSGLSYENDSSGNPTVPIGANIYHIYRTTLQTNSLGEWEAVNGETMIDGYAPSCWYEEMREWTPIIRETPSYDINNWKPIDSSNSNTQGDSVSTAIWTFNGDSPTVNAIDSTTPVYYQMQAASKTYYFNYSSGTYTYYGIATSNDSSVNNYCYNDESGTAQSSNSYTYDPSYSYNPTGSYTITASNLNVMICVYSDSSLSTLEASNVDDSGAITGNTVTFDADTGGVTYYIKVSGATQFTLVIATT